MPRNVIVVTWPEESKAYKALSDLKAVGSSQINQAAVAQRTSNGQLILREGGSNVSGLGTLTGSALGALVGILGGPVGVLLGFSTGALFGSLSDMNTAIDDGSVLAGISTAIRPGMTALIADINEETNSIVDGLVSASGGTLIRRSFDEVHEEVTSAEAALVAATAAAHKAIRDEKRAENKAIREKRWEETKSNFKSFFGIS